MICIQVIVFIIICIPNVQTLCNQVKTNFRMCDSFSLNNLHSTFCNSLYGIEIYNFNKAPLINVYTAWRKCMPVIFCLPITTHNYIISHLNYNIMERLDRRLVKFIYNLLHTNNSTAQSIVKLIVNCCYIQTRC